MSQRKQRFLVSRTTTAPEDTPWRADIDLIDERGWVDRFAARFPERLSSIGYLSGQVLFSLGLIAKARKYDAVAVGRYGNFYPTLAHAVGLSRPTVLMDIERRSVKSSLVDRMAARTASRLCCFTNLEIDRYADSCRIPRHKFAFVPYSAQQRDLRSVTTDKGYIVSAGKEARDWPTVFKAVDGLPYPVHILSDAAFSQMPTNCTARKVSRGEYFDELAGASCVVVSLEKQPHRVTGMLTFVTALALGKPIIVTEPNAGPDYIQQGVTGFCVDYGDAAAIRRHILELMEDPNRRATMGMAARAHALDSFSPEAFRSTITSLLEEVAARPS